jgi:hypothetical protein
MWPKNAVNKREGEKRDKKRTCPALKKPQARKKSEKQRFAESASE